MSIVQMRRRIEKRKKGKEKTKVSKDKEEKIKRRLSLQRCNRR